MTRRQAVLLLIPLGAAAATGSSRRVRGRLSAAADGGVVLRTAEGREWRLEGDPETMAVLRDDRVEPEMFEAVGVEAGAAFRIDPIFRKAMFVVRDGKSLVITYWCEVCAIRTYSPGKCQCCQDETAFDPRDPALEEKAR